MAYPPNLSESESAALMAAASDWAMAHGLAVRPAPGIVDPPLDALVAVPVPLTLFPSPFPKKCFDLAMSVAVPYNDLYAAISRDEEFLAQIVKDIGDSDEFVGKLWKIHLKVKQEGYVQPLSLGVFRSDYMVHAGADQTPTLKQVEFNTIAASFGGLATQASELYRYLATSQYPLLQDAIPQGQLDIPANSATSGIATGIREAFDAYGRSELGHQKCVVLLVQDGERNIFDQRHLEYSLHLNHKSDPEDANNEPIPVFRLPFSETLARTSLADTPKRQLLYRPPTNPTAVYEVAVVYMRCGYGPSDYPDESAWEARYRLERSGAINCPTVLTQLAGAKKVQQVLATPPIKEGASDTDTDTDVLGRYVQGPEDKSRILATFTNIYPMDESEAGLGARQRALDPDLCQAYVLKPQREGGGNNIYRGAIPAFLRSVPEAHWGSFILMELITPPPVQNVILRNGKIERGGVICELGVYGWQLWDHTNGGDQRRDGRYDTRYNREAGFLLRTKGDQSEEGGVAAGFGCMDSVALV